MSIRMQPAVPFAPAAAESIDAVTVAAIADGNAVLAGHHQRQYLSLVPGVGFEPTNPLRDGGF